jgi:hypothetical protein
MTQWNIRQFSDIFQYIEIQLMSSWGILVFFSIIAKGISSMSFLWYIKATNIDPV